MKNVMFQTQVYQYAVDNWEEKKHRLLALIDETKFQYNASFQTDRKDSDNSYLKNFVDIIQPQLSMFQQELRVSEVVVTDVWCVKYQTGDFHPVHTHSSRGYSGVLYLEYNEIEHTGTFFVNPITDPITDLTNYSLPNVHEGAIVIAPSNVLHFTLPNKSKDVRIVVGFDIKFKT
jgi:hypothetical protein